MAVTATGSPPLQGPDQYYTKKNTDKPQPLSRSLYIGIAVPEFVLWTIYSYIAIQGIIEKDFTSVAATIFGLITIHFIVGFSMLRPIYKYEKQYKKDLREWKTNKLTR